AVLRFSRPDALPRGPRPKPSMRRYSAPNSSVDRRRDCRWCETSWCHYSPPFFFSPFHGSFRGNDIHSLTDLGGGVSSLTNIDLNQPGFSPFLLGGIFFVALAVVFGA